MRTTSDYLTHLHIVGDRLLLGVITGCFVLSLVLAPWYGTFDAALLVGLPAALVPALLTWARPGALVTRCAIAASLMIFAALHIQQSHGMIELHFGIFAMLAFLLFYRDWIPLVFAAGVIAVHHLAFDAMQRAGLPVWAFRTDGGLGIVLIHAGFVVFETALLVWMAVILRAEIEAVGCDPRELSEVAQQIAHGNLTVRIRDTGSESSLAHAMEVMRSDLESHLERERAIMSESSRVRTALDRVAVGAMLVDDKGKIRYVNDYAQTMFRARAADIRDHAPEFDLDHIVGAAFEGLRTGTANERDVLARLDRGQSHEFSMGNAVFRISATPVMDEQGGTRLGTVVQWTDRTLEVGVEDDLKATVARAIEGDLTARVAVSDKEGFFKVISVGVNELVGKMADAVRTMSDAASQVRVGADEISRGNQHLSGRTEQQAASLEQTASSMQEMTSTVKRNAENAAQANQLAAAARQQAERGGRVVSSAVTAMSQIDAASKKIADIIGVIDEIAFQTNLLALNAAVEAARAGEQGRGFAVVAAEVRNLASRSAAAAREIKALINDSVNKVSEGTSLVNESGTVLVEIVDSVKNVTDVVAAIALSSREQAAGIEMVNKAVAIMDSSTQQNGALVEEASAAAQALTEQATALTQLIARYNVGIEHAAPAAIPPKMKDARSPPKTQAPAPAIDKRGATRPWKTRVTATGTSESPALDAAGADSVWKEF